MLQPSIAADYGLTTVKKFSDTNPPTHTIPCLAYVAKFGWTRAIAAVSGCDAGATDRAGSIGENDIAWGHFAKKIVEAVARAILFALG